MSGGSSGQGRAAVCGRGRIAAVAVALLASSVGSAPVEAAVACPLLRDRPGDGSTLNNWGAGLLPEDRSLDLLSLDLSSDRDRLLARVRVNRLERTFDRKYQVWFATAGTRFWLEAHLPRELASGAPTFRLGTAEYQAGRETGSTVRVLGDVPGWVDARRSTVSFLVDAAVLRKAVAVRTGSEISDVFARSLRASAAYDVGADWTDGTARHVFGSGGCTRLPRR